MGYFLSVFHDSKHSDKYDTNIKIYTAIRRKESSHRDIQYNKLRSAEKLMKTC